jgi:dipeptidyl aminopeptidase/acylaminoacyl peptidase
VCLLAQRRRVQQIVCKYLCCAVSVALSLSAPGSARDVVPEQSRSLTLDSIVAIKEISHLSWSPNGRWIAFLYAEGPARSIYVVDPDEGSPRRASAPGSRVATDFGSTERLSWSPDSDSIVYSQDGDLYIARVSNHAIRRLTETAGVESAPRFSPDGRRVLFVRDGDVWTLSVDGGEEIQLTNSAKEGWKNFSPQWSPDGSSILFTSTDTRLDASISVMQWDRLLVRPTTLRENIAQSEVKVGVVGKDGGKVLWLASDQPNIYSTRGGSVALWSPDGMSVLMNKISADQKQRDILIASARDGKARIVYTERDDKWISPQSRWLRWSPDGSRILFSSEKTGWNHLYVLNSATGNLQQLTDGQFTVQTPFEYDSRECSPIWSQDGRSIYFAAKMGNPIEQQFYMIPSSGGPPKRITDNSGFYAGSVVSPREDRIATVYSTVTTPWELYVMPNQPGARPKKMTVSVPADLEHYAWVEPRFVTFPSKADGRLVQAQLFVPPGLDKTKKVAAIVHVHGEGYLQYVTKGWGAGTGGAHIYPFIQYLVGRGYVVLNLDFRGSSGYGREWRVGVYRDLGGIDLQDVVGGLEYLQSLGFVDTKRVGIFGRSYGGFMTLMAMFRAPGRFAVGVADRPVGNWERFYYLAAGYDLERFGASPDVLRDIYMRSSPVSYTQNLRGKLLIVGAMLDLMFPDVTELTSKLIKEKKDFDVMIYPNEPHGFRYTENMVDVLRRTSNFLETHLAQ